jgi:hypothetical protein
MDDLTSGVRPNYPKEVPMKVKIYLNENSGFRSFNPFRAQLRVAVEFDLDVTEPEFVFEYDSTTDNEQHDAAYTAARKEHEKWVDPILNMIYTQLNVGGDMIYPAEDWTVEYRMAGNRSLSVGDLVVFEVEKDLSRLVGRSLTTTDTLAFSVESVGFKPWLSSMAVRRGLKNYEEADKFDHFVPQPRTDLAVNDEGMFYLKGTHV